MVKHYLPIVAKEEDIYIERCLIENPPEDRKILNQLFINYVKENGIDLCSLPLNVHSYAFDFYKYSGCTQYFIKHAEDPGGFSSNMIDEDCMDDGYSSFYYRRDEKDPCKWICNNTNPNFIYPDTIVCTGCKDKVYGEIKEMRYNQ